GNISGTSYTDTTAAGGTPYFYAVVAVSVMASASSNEQSATATNAPPPAPVPPAAPRTEKVGNPDHRLCGSATADARAPSGTALGALLAVAALLGAFRRRSPMG